jgi:hypothetical protein
MIVLTKGEIQNVIFTGTENCQLVAPYFLFIFTNRITNEVVSFVATNESDTKRYDYFMLIVDDQFGDSETGFWTYDIYEQESSAGTNPEGKHKVETGLMYLHPVDTFTPIEYNEQDNTFKTYNG